MNVNYFNRRKKLFVPVDTFLSFDYVRETSTTVSNPVQTIERRKRPFFGDQHGGILGYTVLYKERRYLIHVLIWWLKNHDRPVMPDGPYRLSPEHRDDPNFKCWGPCEAITPLNVLKVWFPELLPEVATRG